MTTPDPIDVELQREGAHLDAMKAEILGRADTAIAKIKARQGGTGQPTVRDAAVASQAVARVDPRLALKREVERYEPQISRALPASYEGGGQRFVASVLNAVRTDKTGKLQTCSVESIVGAALHSAQLGLEIGPLGEAYLVPYGKVCTFMPGWKGLRKLAFQGGIDIVAKAVRSGDQFDHWWDENGPHLMFRPQPGTAGKPIAYFGLAKPVTGGMADIIVVDQAWVNRRRDAGQGGSSWKDWPEEMALKTVVKTLAAAAPKSTKSERLAIAVATDGIAREQIDADPQDFASDDDDVVDGELVD